MSKQAGFEGTFLVGASELDIVRDVSMTINGNLIDVTARDSGGWRERIGGIKEFTYTVNVIYKKGSPAYQTLRTALLNGTKVVDVIFKYKGGEGFKADVFVDSIDQGQPFEDADTVDITIMGTSVPVFNSSIS